MAKRTAGLVTGAYRAVSCPYAVSVDIGRAELGPRQQNENWRCKRQFRFQPETQQRLEERSNKRTENTVDEQTVAQQAWRKELVSDSQQLANS
jgi:hypothetical protein